MNKHSNIALGIFYILMTPISFFVYILFIPGSSEFNVEFGIFLSLLLFGPVVFFVTAIIVMLVPERLYAIKYIPLLYGIASTVFFSILP